MRKILAAVFFFVLTFALFVPSFAKEDEESVYSVKKDGDFYVLESVGESLTFDSANELLTYINDGARICFVNVVLQEEMYISKDITISGSLTSCGIEIAGGARVSLNSANITFSGQAMLSVTDGHLEIESSDIYAGEASAVSVYSGSSLNMISGRISASGVYPAMVIFSGSADLKGGVIENPNGSAVLNFGILRLGKSILFNSGSFDVVTDNPIYLKSENEEYSGALSVKVLKEFCDGESEAVFFDANASNIYDIKVYDANNKSENLTFFDERYESKNVIAVHKPFSVTYISDGAEIHKIEVLNGEVIELIDVPYKAGYTQVGWSISSDGFGIAPDTVKISSDTVFYSVYNLIYPEFLLSGCESVYDGRTHKLSLDKLTHPIENEGFYTYRWVDVSGNTISDSAELSYTNVADSGKYKCIITFHHGQNSVTVETPYVEIKVHKRVVAPPEATSKYYTGKPQYPDVDPSDYYTISEGEYTDAGVYEIVISLKDKANNCFTDGSDQYSISFSILRAENVLIGEFNVNDIYYGAEINFKVESRFGDVRLFYSSELDGEYSETPPHSVGTYYVRAKVAASGNYTELVTEAKSFRIIDDTPLSLSLLSPPLKSEYFAFDYLMREGLEFSVVFSSGRRGVISGESVVIEYQKDSCFRYGDTAFFAEYLGVRTSVPITVKKAEYELNIDPKPVIFNFDGTYKSYPFDFTLPIGKDGIPLDVKISGGGSNTGEYEICISFFSSGVDYVLPAPIYTKLIIEKRVVSPVWYSTSFVYDGAVKCPGAYYVDCYGAHIPLRVEGGSVSAGDGYVAKAYIQDANYRLDNDTVSFSIAKAFYDMSGAVWSASSFVYDGTEKRVTVSGLPNGVVAIGYSDSYAINAGEYCASVSFSYDEQNYNAPSLAPFVWRIEKADYDFRDFGFLGGDREYNGEMHYPTTIGEIPVGMDGISLSFSFSRGVLNVLDNPYVIVKFFTESQNYNVPADLVVELNVVPKGIIVIWDGLCSVYSGNAVYPTAYSEECGVVVTGVGCNAGAYTVECTSLDPNYTVVNGIAELVISKAQNYWLEAPTVGTTFEGKAPSARGEAHYGVIRYTFYKDKECQLEAIPDYIGVFYAVARVDESDNFYELVSDPIEFSVIAVEPIGISVRLNTHEFIAFETLGQEDFYAEYINNDGSSSPLSSSLLTVKYESGTHLLAKHKTVTFELDSFIFSCSIEVSRAVYDMSGAVWENTVSVYDGKCKSPSLTGLPDGVSVLSVVGADSPEAGEYQLDAVFEYDRENYEAPIAPKGTLLIKKQVITPKIEKEAIYNGAEQKPFLSSQLYYPKLDVGYKNAGAYRIELVLTDPLNYAFEADAFVTFVIKPCEVMVQINKIDVYLFEDPIGQGYTVISGTVFDGDDLMLAYVYDGERVYAEAENENYNAIVRDGIIEYIPRPTPDTARALFICFLLALILILILLTGLRNRERIMYVLSDARERIAEIRERRNQAYLSITIPKLEHRTGSVDVAHADALLSNGIARTLLRRSEEKIITEGSKRVIVNIDTISENFSDGDTVNINTLKEKGLICSDAGYIKILARGRIDKALKVYANSFSISAVKMIALTGGEVYRVSSNKNNKK